MSNNGRYNGWSNYETWRVNLELFDGYDPEGTWVTGEGLEEMANEWLDGQAAPGSFAQGILGAFLSEVNWQEIADGINAAYELADPDAEEATEEPETV